MNMPTEARAFAFNGSPALGRAPTPRSRQSGGSR